MKDYDVWYNGTIIGNIKADSIEEAQRKCDAEYSVGIHGKPTVLES